MFLNYQELSTNYKKNLDEKLRGFAGGPGFLETWTDDEGDPKRAVMDLIDLAIESGEELVVIHAPGIAGWVDLGGYKDGIINYDGGGNFSYKSKRSLDILSDIQELLSDMKYEHEVRVAGLKGGVLTLDYEEKTPDRPLHHALIKLEDYLNQRLESRVSIQTLNVEDKNKRKCRA